MRKYVACANAPSDAVSAVRVSSKLLDRWSAGRPRPATTVLGGRDARRSIVFFSITPAVAYNTPNQVYSCSP